MNGTGTCLCRKTYALKGSWILVLKIPRLSFEVFLTPLVNDMQRDSRSFALEPMTKMLTTFMVSYRWTTYSWNTLESFESVDWPKSNPC